MENKRSLTYPERGIVIAQRSLAKCQRGDCLVEIGKIVDPPAP
jgi:hypothetical protein